MYLGEKSGKYPDGNQVIVHGSELLEAKIAYQKIERVQSREEPAYYFEFPVEKAAIAAKLVGIAIGKQIYGIAFLELYFVVCKRIWVQNIAYRLFVGFYDFDSCLSFDKLRMTTQNIKWVIGSCPHQLLIS